MTKNPFLKQNSSCFFVFCFVLFSVPFLFLWFNVVIAAELRVSSPSSEFGIGQQFQVDLILDTDNEDINAVEGKIIFPADILEVKEIRDGNSIINFWIEKPKAKNGEILFSGIIPGGYMDKKGLIFSVVFQSIQEGRGSIEIRDIKTLLNDGKGTEAGTTISNLQFLISKKLLDSIFYSLDSKKDTDMPEEFKPEIAQSLEMFEGKWFLVFATQDKGSGIDHYEVCEGSKKKCVIVESPYLLQNQKLDQQIFVKAIDKSGNEKVVMLPPQKPLPWYKNYTILAILIIIVFVAGVILRKLLWQKFIKSR